MSYRLNFFHIDKSFTNLEPYSSPSLGATNQPNPGVNELNRKINTFGLSRCYNRFIESRNLFII